MDGARLWTAVLRGADLTGALGLTQAQLNQACTDSSTILPDTLTLSADARANRDLAILCNDPAEPRHLVLDSGMKQDGWTEQVQEEEIGI